MTLDQWLIVAILAMTLVLFIWDRWRYDLVALGALVVVVLTGLVPADTAFSGFGHPATITVAAILVATRGLANSGAVDLLARPVITAARTPAHHASALCGVGALLSSFMNNVAALALLMPVAIQTATKAQRSPSLVLMPLAFATVLGGIVTLIGTPPNIILSSFRRDAIGEPFKIFDFTPVGLPVALAGVAFLAAVGWRMLGSAASRRTTDVREAVREYLAEIRIEKNGAVEGKTLRDFEEKLSEVDVVIFAVVRNERRVPVDPQWLRLQEGDVLLVEGDPDELDKLISILGGRLMAAEGEDEHEHILETDSFVEAVVRAEATVVGSAVRTLFLGRRFGVHLLAVARQGRPFRGRLRSFTLAAGDVLLLQGDPDRLAEAVSRLGLLALAPRPLQFGQRGRSALGIALFAVPVSAAALGFVALPVALAASALMMVLTRLIPLRDLYESVDWPVIVLLGAMMPVGDAFQRTGTTGLLANAVASLADDVPMWAILAALIFVTMLLSDLLNNAATAVMMGPVAVAMSKALGVGPDTFLMAVAIGASCSFMTPVGHQNYTLVMGPGGYAFRDYWRLGLPLEIIVILVATPLLLLFWPL